MRWNWRFCVARELAYVDLGRYLLTLPYQLVLIGGAVRLLWPDISRWELIACAPAVLVVCSLVGRVHKRYGWQQQSTEVSSIEQLSRLQFVGLVWQARQAEKLGYPLNNIPEELPHEIREILASSKAP